MGVKLHVGCGGDIRPGYVNIDEFDPRADVKMPLQRLTYPEASVERLEGYMVLEHLSPEDALAFVTNAHRMLEPGGMLVLECPDLAKVSRLIVAFADDADYLERGAFGLRGIFGEPTDHMTSGDYHKWGYTPSTAIKLMRAGGFKDVRILDGTSHAYPLRDMRVEAVK